MSEHETFEQYLARTLHDAGLRSYGHNNPDDLAAEQACYRRAMGCFYLPSGAPMGAEGPPWGIHSEGPREAPHEAALPGYALPYLTVQPPALLQAPDMGQALLDWIDSLPDAGADEDTNPKDKAASTKVPMWSLPSIGAVHGAMSTGDGIRKNYGAYNWREKPISMMEHIGAMERHLAALKDGEDFTRDSDVGITHLGCINAGTAILLDAQQCGTLIDDRPRAGFSTSADALEDYHDHHSKS